MSQSFYFHFQICFFTGDSRCPGLVYKECVKRRPPYCYEDPVSKFYLAISKKIKGSIWFTRQNLGNKLAA